MGSVDRVLVLGLDGATYDALRPLADAGVMPNVARLLKSAAVFELESTAPCITPVAWTTFQTGADPQDHRVWDFRRLATAPARLELNDARQIALPTLLEIVERAGGPVVSLHLPMTSPSRCSAASLVVGGLEAPSSGAALDAAPRLRDELRRCEIELSIDPIWRRRPRSFEELQGLAAATARDFQHRTRAALVADRLVDWRLMFVQFQALDNLQHRAWHLLGLGGPETSTGPWVEETRQALRALDQCVGQLLELAARRGAVAMACSDHGFGPFRGKVSLPHLFERHDLIRPARGAAWWEYRAARGVWKLGRMLPWNRQAAARRSRSLAAQTPLDWRRSRIVAAHGNLAALIYFNAPERFGRGPLRSFSDRRQTAADALAALRGARHPETGEALFVEAFETAERFDVDPLAEGIPDLVGIPADGFHTRHKFGPSGQEILDDAELTGTHRRMGIWMVEGPGVQGGLQPTAALRDVAPTILDHLRIARPPSMTGRSWAASRGRATPNTPAPLIHGLDRASRDAGPTLTTAEQQAVEQRLRHLGYVE